MSVSQSMSGERIKALRQALGLSQVELAALLGISNVTVNRWEKNHALPQPATTERLLRLERDGRATPRGSPDSEHGNLPPAFTPLVGRATDLETIAELLTASPLVTVSGPGGAGKTRLAIETGRATAARFPDGVWFVDLDAVVDPGDVLHAAARVLGLREAGRKPLADRLGDEFRQRTLLLIFDNCEHLRSACAALAARLLGVWGASRILATSRVPLAVPGEAVYALRSLASADAETLFLQRAREHQPGLAPDSGQSRAIAEICLRLDGLPLAIELAAARTHVLSVEQIAGRLDRRFELLRTSGAAPPRQRALDTAIAWSCDLLETAEATLFRGLGVFVGWFDLAAVEAIADPDGALDLLDSLARQSMIVVEHDASTRSARYRLLESLAAYARAWLDERGETTATARRHAAYYAELAEDRARGLRGSGQAMLLAALDREHDNLIAALEWLLASGDARKAIGLAAALGPYWRLRGRYAEGSAWLERALGVRREVDGGWREGHDSRSREERIRSHSTFPLSPFPPSPPALAALNQLGALQYHAGRLDEALRTLEMAIALGRELSSRDEEARALDTLGLVLAGRRDLARAATSHEAALALFLEVGDRARAAMSRLYLGNLANLRGEHKTAERAYHEAWSLVQRTGDTAAEAQILSNLGEIAARTGRFQRALGYYERTLTLLRAVGDPDRLAAVAANTAEVQLALGDVDPALALATEAVAQYRTVGNPAHLAGALYVQGAASAAAGQRAAALAQFRESLALYDRMTDWIDIVYCVEAIARLFAGGGDPALAARLLGGAETLRERDRIADYPLFDLPGTLATIHAALDSTAIGASWAEGRLLAPEELVIEAMLVGSIADGDPIHVLTVRRTVPAVSQPERALTARQIEVLRLVAAGLSNREIGEALAISDRTVERHLTAVYSVLDVDRRSAAVARASAAGLLDLHIPDRAL